MKANYPAKIYDSFSAWEHKFIVEEYIEGDSLSIWMVNKYPFSSESNNENYVKSSINILNQLIKAIKELHNLNIGFGDLQPANIIVSKEEKNKINRF